MYVNKFNKHIYVFKDDKFWSSKCLWVLDTYMIFVDFENSKFMHKLHDIFSLK